MRFVWLNGDRCDRWRGSQDPRYLTKIKPGPLPPFPQFVLFVVGLGEVLASLTTFCAVFCFVSHSSSLTGDRIGGLVLRVSLDRNVFATPRSRGGKSNGEHGETE